MHVAAAEELLQRQVGLLQLPEVGDGSEDVGAARLVLPQLDDAQGGLNELQAAGL